MPGWTNRSPACSPRAWSFTRPIRPRAATGSCRPRSRSKAPAQQRRGTLAATGEPIEIGSIEKMSKSKRNTVDPDDIIGSFGADTARWFMLSDSPPERDVIWTEEGVQGAWRFVQRLWRLVHEAADQAAVADLPRPAVFGEPALALRKAAHRALARVSEDIERLRFNVCVAHIYEFANAFQTLARQPGNRADRRLPLGAARSQSTSWCNCSTR